MVGGEDVALGCHVNDLSKSAGHSDALRRNGNSRPVPHPHLRGNDGIKETARFGGLFISPPTKGFIARRAQLGRARPGLRQRLRRRLSGRSLRTHVLICKIDGDRKRNRSWHRGADQRGRNITQSAILRKVMYGPILHRPIKSSCLTSESQAPVTLCCYRTISITLRFAAENERMLSTAVHHGFACLPG